MKTAAQQLAELAVRLRSSATIYRGKADTQDRHACAVELLAVFDETEAKAALAKLMETMPAWFPVTN